MNVSKSDNSKASGPLALPTDLIRTVAIVLVILLHASNEYYGTVAKTTFETNLYWWTSTVYKSIAIPCVPLFIMLSGALLLQPSKMNEPVRVFLKKRLSRIGLAFVFWGIVYLAWAFVVTGVPFTIQNAIQGAVKGIFTGPYYHFWFLYVLAGLYLITPLLRIIIGYGERKIVQYLIILWFLGVAVAPLFGLAAGYTLLNGVFVIGGWVGYFVMGTYLQRTTINFRSSSLYLLLIAGTILTIFSTWTMNFTFSSLNQYNFFMDDLAANVILASVMMFIILSRFPVNWPRTNKLRQNSIIGAISKNTLPIYLFHIIILESLQKGYFGFKLSLTTINPIIEIPLITFVTLFITLGLILLMKKVPILKRVIG